MSANKTVSRLAVALTLMTAACSAPATRTISGTPQDDLWRGNSGSFDSPASAERHGCCAGNGGACGCGHGKVQCCDGSASPKCSCE